ncbi:hypothetical protein [Pseudomonas putida]|uniref:hypothetical protein n=1 Tax=Pseudomonas putida TaxID=303 RepID=UPI0015BD05A8|nr:hypothetical protein [Pseudomonas putida]
MTTDSRLSIDMIDAVETRVTGSYKSIQCKDRPDYCVSNMNKSAIDQGCFPWNMSFKI